MSDCFIEYLNYYRPGNTVGIKQILEEQKLPESHKKYILKYSHLDRICAEDKLDCCAMFDEIMADCLKNHPARDIKFLMFAGEDRFINSGISVPYYLVGKYNLDNTSIITVNQGCSSALQSLEIARYIVKSNADIKVLIASISKVDSVKDRFIWPSALGDGTGIMLVGNSGNLKVINCCSYSDGTKTLQRYMNSPENQTEPDIIETEKEIVRSFKKLFHNLLCRSGLTINDISLIIPQNANHLICKLHAKAVNASLDSFFVDNIPNGGHIGSVDDTINLKDALLSGRVGPGDKIIVVSAGEIGGNVNYAAALIEICS